MAAFQTYSFEAGTPGSSLTLADIPAAGDTQLDLATIGTSSTMAYDTAHAAHGGQSVKIATTSAVSGQGFFGWSNSIGTTTQIWMRAYCYFTGNPSGTTRLLGAFNGGTIGALAAVSASGKILLLASAGTTVLTGGTAIPAGSWFRLEFMGLASATVGQLEFRLFLNPESTLPDETGTTSALQNTGASFTAYRFGQSTPTAAGIGPFWMDDAAASTTGYPGPVPSAAPDVTAALPGPAWRAYFQPSNPRRPHVFISLPGNTQISDGDTGGASGEDVTGINATQASADTGSGADSVVSGSWTRVQQASNGAITASLAIGAGQGWSVPQAGHLIVVWADSGAALTLSNAGFTAVFSNNQNAATRFWAKIADGSSDGTITITLTSNNVVAGAAEFATPLSVTADASSQTLTNLDGGSFTDTTALTTLTAHDLVVAVEALRAPAIQAPPPGPAAWAGFAGNGGAGIGAVQAVTDGQTGIGNIGVAGFMGACLDSGAAQTDNIVPTWTATEYEQRALMSVAFKPAAGLFTDVLVGSIGVSSGDSATGAEATGKIAFPDSDAGAGADAGEQRALADSDTGAGTETAAFAGLRQPELLRAKPGPAWRWHFKPGLARKPVISLPDSLVAVQISDGDTGTVNEGGGFPTTDADTSAAAVETEQVTVLDTDTGTSAATSSTGLAGSDTGTGAGSDPSRVGFTPPPGALYVQPVATGPTPKVGSTLVLTVNAGVITTPGNVVVLNCRSFSASHLISVTDSRGNLWQIDSTGSTSGSNISVASAVMGASAFLRAGDTITVTNSTVSINDGSSAPQAGAVEYSGIAVAGGLPVVRLTSVLHTTASPTTVTMASAGAAGDLAYTAQAAGASSSTFTLTAADPSSGGLWADRAIPGTSGTGTDAAAQTAAGPSGYSATWAWTGGGNGTGVIVLYAGAGTAPPILPGSETAAGDDEQILDVLGSDTGTSAGTSTSSTGLSDSDTGTGTEASTQGPSDSDTGTGLDVSASNNKASADTGTFAETALAGPATFAKHDFDTALGQDIGISYVSDSDVLTAGELAAALFADSDSFAGDDEEDAGGGPFLIADGDEFAGAEAGGPLRPITGTDTGSGSEAVSSFPAVSAETGTGADIEVPAQGVDVWPGIPDSAWRFGRMRVVWREGTPDEVVLAEGPPSGKLFRFQARVHGIYSLTLIRDADTGSGTDAQTPVANVSAAVLATRVAIEIPGTPGPPGMFGYASGFPREET